jgi:hypothetical protein
MFCVAAIPTRALDNREKVLRLFMKGEPRIHFTFNVWLIGLGGAKALKIFAPSMYY